MGKKSQRNPVVSAVLSALVPGLGQIYSGAWKRGLTLLFGLTAQAALFYGVGMPSLIPGLLAVWAWNIYDAARTAKGLQASATPPAIILILLNVIPAWNTSQVHAPSLESQQRQVIRQIATDLAKPDFTKKDSTEETATAKYIVPGPGAPESVTPVPAKPGQPSMSISPVKGASGATLTVNGEGFTPNGRGTLQVLGASETKVGRFSTDSQGKFRTSFTNPRFVPGDYFLKATVNVPTGKWVLSDTLKITGPLMFQTIYLALLGTLFSLVFAIPLSFLGARNLMSGSPLLRAVYGATRGLFTVLRSVEVLIIAVIAVAALGIGPFAGVIALAIHGIGALGKLYSEAIESIDHGPIEAVRSTGANDVQVVSYAVVPQVVPQFIAFTLYRWDINVRMATIIGLVGGGGIGAKLIEYTQLFQWREAATAIWLIAAVVMLMDYASAVIREKLI